MFRGAIVFTIMHYTTDVHITTMYSVGDTYDIVAYGGGVCGLIPDEWATGACENTCEEAGRALRLERELAKQRLEQGGVYLFIQNHVSFSYSYQPYLTKGVLYSCRVNS